jgi:hypothetical protein
MLVAMPPLQDGKHFDPKSKHQEYFENAKFYKRLYYASRLSAGFAAVLLPFVVPYSPAATILLSVIVAFVTVADTIVAPRERWRLNGTASNRLWLEEVKQSGDYEKYKNAIDQIMQTEDEDFKLAVSLKGLMDDIAKQDAAAKVQAEPAAPKVGQ